MDQLSFHTLTDSTEFLKALYGKCPLSIWASLGSKHDYKIVYWNQGAESIYGIPAATALGKNYLDLFVADEGPQVRADSARECDEIIEHGRSFVNYLAVDQKTIEGKKSDEKILLLTNVFRMIVDAQGYQVEIAVDITSSGLLEFRRPEFRRLTQVVDQIKREVQLTTYDNISSVGDISKLEEHILTSLVDLTQSQGGAFAVRERDPKNESILTVRKTTGLDAESIRHLKQELGFEPLSQLRQHNSEAVRHFGTGEYFAAVVTFSPNIAGLVWLFHSQRGYFDIQRREAAKSFLARVSGLYEVSRRFDFNKLWRISYAHELASASNKIKKAFDAYFERHPEALADDDMQNAIHANLLQLDLAQNLIAMGRSTDDSVLPEAVFTGIIECIDQGIDSQIPNIRIKGQSVDWNHELMGHDVGKPISLRGKKHDVERFLRVLINNASKYSPRGSKIHIRANAKADFVEIEVVNDGDISEEVFMNAFEAEPLLLLGTQKDGAHIGLHVSQKLARAYGGDIILSLDTEHKKVHAKLQLAVVRPDPDAR